MSRRLAVCVDLPRWFSLSLPFLSPPTTTPIDNEIHVDPNPIPSRFPYFILCERQVRSTPSTFSPLPNHAFDQRQRTPFLLFLRRSSGHRTAHSSSLRRRELGRRCSRDDGEISLAFVRDELVEEVPPCDPKRSPSLLLARKSLRTYRTGS